MKIYNIGGDNKQLVRVSTEVMSKGVYYGKENLFDIMHHPDECRNLYAD